MQEEEVAPLGPVFIRLPQVGMGLPPLDTDLRLQATGLPPPQVVPLGTDQPLEECQRDMVRLHQAEEALATQPRVTLMAAEEAGEG